MLFLCALLLVGSVCAAPDLRWNGFRDPVLDVEGPFTSFYVPPGALLIDDAEETLSVNPRYAWHSLHDHSFLHGSSLAATAPGASFSLSFYGVRLLWYGTKSPFNGQASVYIDGHPVSESLVDSYAPVRDDQTLIFATPHLRPGHHTLYVNVTGSHSPRSMGTMVYVDSFVVESGGDDAFQQQKPRSSYFTHVARDFAQSLATTTKKLGRAVAPHHLEPVTSDAWKGDTLLKVNGETGVAAMQLAMVDDHHAIIFDKVEHNLLTIDGRPAWAALYNLDTDTAQPLRMLSNSFCAGGTFLSNGTLVSLGGNPVVVSHTGPTDFGDTSGLQAVRLFNPCFPTESETVSSCAVFEQPSRIRMGSPRWYPSASRLIDGSVFILGGSVKGGWINNATVNNPTYEYYPPKRVGPYNGTPVPSPFLTKTLNANLFPIAITLTDGRIFIAANNDAIIYDWQNDREQPLPSFPNGIRVTYPMSASAVLLPLTPENGYTDEILVCGGSDIDDTRGAGHISSQEPATTQCTRMVLTAEGIKKGWIVEHMPETRVMPELVMMPDGKIVIVNGAHTGLAGYGNAPDLIGQSNADNPAFRATLYDPQAPKGRRFTTKGFPTSEIPRMYHSVASLTPQGDIMLAGSNPNSDRRTRKYQTEYRVERLIPPYMQSKRPEFTGLPERLAYATDFDIHVRGIKDGSRVEVSLMDLGFVTHALHMNSRLVKLKSVLVPGTNAIVRITGPPNSGAYPPGFAWLYVLVDGIPSPGKRVLIGSGSDPPYDADAHENMLAQTENVDLLYDSSTAMALSDGGEGTINIPKHDSSLRRPNKWSWKTKGQNKHGKNSTKLKTHGSKRVLQPDTFQ